MSNIIDITTNDFENICRTCLCREDLKPLYEKFLPSTCFADMLMTCTFLKFRENDGLPSKICTNCINEINQAFSFAKRCETTDTILRKCIENDKTKLVNNSSQSQKVEPIMEIKIKQEIILPDTTEEEVLGDYEFVGLPQQEHTKIKYEYEAPMDEYEDQDKMYSEKSANYQLGQESLNEEGGSFIANRTNNNLSKIKLYECKKCSEKFPDLKGLKKHRKEIKHHPNIPSSCPVCHKMVEHHWKRHMRTHTGEKPYGCDICGAHFSAGNNLRRHKLTQHSQPNDLIYKCQTCEKSFKRLDMLKVHQKIHTEEKKSIHMLSRDFQCTLCVRAFTTKKLLHQHSIVHEEKKFWCSVCGKGFVKNGLLISHAKVHTGERPYACLVCEKRFAELVHLKRHKLIHSDEKPHVCSVCSKGFTLSTSLKYHMRSHTGEKPYSCEICGKGFSKNSNLTTHKRIHKTRAGQKKLIELARIPK